MLQAPARHDGVVTADDVTHVRRPLGDLAEPADPRATLEQVLAAAQVALAVETIAVWTADSTGLHLVLNAATGLDEVIREGHRVAIRASFVGRVATSRAPVHGQHDDVADAGLDDSIVWDRRVRSLLGVPLVDGHRQVGVIVVGSQDPRPFGGTEVVALQEVAQRAVAALTIERALVERRAARTLQESLLPTELPHVDGLEFASRFVPAEDFGVGGDWFDVFPLPDGQTGVVIGDVAGSGLRAAVVMGRLRSALRAYAIESQSPSEALTRLDRKFAHFEPNEMATILYLIVARDLRSFTVSSTGHLPPVVAEPGGATRVLDCVPSAPIGTHFRTERVDLECALHPGTTVVCYTDGLVERRREPLDVGLERLRSAVIAGPPEVVCHMVTTELVGARSVEDDTALLVFRRAP